MFRVSVAKIIFIFVSAACVSSAFGEDAEYASVAQLKAKGFVKCSGSQSTVTKFVYAKENFEYLNLWNANHPDTHMATTVTSRKFSDGSGVAVITTTPTASGECDSNLVQIFYSAESCSQLRETTFKEWKFFNDLGGTPVYDDPTAENVSVVLAPNNNGCLVVKYAALFFPAETKAGTKAETKTNTKK